MKILRNILLALLLLVGALVIFLVAVIVFDGMGDAARLDAVTGSELCPLLTDDCCPLYAARPVICRFFTPVVFATAPSVARFPRRITR